MPAPSKIKALLSEGQQAELNRRIRDNGFGGYRELAEWLQSEGFEISKSAVHSHGQALQRQIEKIRAASEQAAALRDLFPDDEGAMTDASLRMFQAELYNYMQDFEIDANSMDPIKLAKAIKDLAHASISQKKLQREVRAEERALAAEDAADAATNMGLSAEAVAKMRAAVLGQAPEEDS